MRSHVFHVRNLKHDKTTSIFGKRNLTNQSMIYIQSNGKKYDW